MVTSSSQAQGRPHEPAVVRNRDHPPDVENSILQILYDIGSPNPKAFTRRWPLEDILEALNEIQELLHDGRKVRNPAGMLWRMMEERESAKNHETRGDN